MAYRMTKEELDQQFEQFLRESISDDSVELGNSSTHPSVLDQLGKVPQKQVKKSNVSVPWWQDDDSEEAPGKDKAAKCRFIKDKISQAVDIQEDSGQTEHPSVPIKPIPKPRSKALDRASHLGKIHLHNQEASDNTDRQRVSEHIAAKPKNQSSKDHRYSKEQRDSENCLLTGSSSPFMLEKSHNAPRHTSIIVAESENAPTESSCSDSSDSEDGLMASGKTFRKSLKKSQPILEVDEDQMKERCFEDEYRGDAVIFSRDSLEPEDSLMISGSTRNSVGLGLDTLNEEKEKARIFGNLGRETESLSDDPRLSNQQESYSSTVTSPQSRGEVMALINQDQREGGEAVSITAKVNLPPSPTYSEDFEDESSEKEPEEKKPERRGMLAKVSLHDSLNSTDGALAPALGIDVAERKGLPDSRMAEATKSGQSYGQSGASEMEALQEAYRQVSRSVGECEGERFQEHSRHSASSSSPEFSRGTLKHVSTTESDLPTAEELMRAIGPDSEYKYGMPLQPLCEEATELSGGKVVSEGNPTDNREPDRSSPALIEQKLAPTSNKHRSIAEEVKRLMQEQEESSPKCPSVCSKSKKQQVSGKSSTIASVSSASRKAPFPSGRSTKADIRPASKASAPNRTKRPPPLAQRKSQSQPLNRPPALNQTHTIKSKAPDSDLRLNHELIASVQSLTAFLQQQIEVNNVNTGSPDQSESIKEVPANTDHDLPSPQSSLQHLRLQLAQKERQLLIKEEQLHEEHRKEISALRQENYLLQSKLNSVEEAGKKQRWNLGEGSDQVTEEKVRLIEKELKEQETLIQGYHLENEKLYMQMKSLKAQCKQNEESMFTENQRLLSELALAKDQLKRSSKQKTVGSINAGDQEHSVTELMAQVQAAQRREVQLQEETHKLKQEKQALQVDLQMMKRERDLAKAQVIYTSGDRDFELKLLEERHKEEVSELKKRLQWYAENQELLDKDAARLRAANAETQKLTEQVEKLKMEVAKQANQQQKKMKERAGEAKRIQDLERQVKEMEEILRRRHPNSLPALIYAAAAASGEDVEGNSRPHAAPQPSQTAALLERRIHRLEAELEGHDEEAKRSLRAMEQQFQRIKLQYEQQISELEQRLAEQNQEQCLQSGTQALPVQEDIEQLKKTHLGQVSALKAEVASLQEQIQAHSLMEREKPSHSPSRHQRQAEAAQANRIERLSQELATKSRTIQELHRTVERLQRERRTMLSAPRVDGSCIKPKQNSLFGQAKNPVPAETFPPTQDEKDYQPRIFSGSHISEVQQENDKLKLRQEQLELQWQQERVLLETAATQAHSDLQRAQERNQEQLVSIKAEHQREMDHLMARHALDHSSSKVAELTNQLKMQETMVLHLREQLKELQSTKDALVVSKLREETLQNQLAKLLEELKQAKEAHTPELRHFASLEHKIQSMEHRYNQREQELQQMIAQTRSVVEREQQAEVACWKRLAQGKSSELEAFRLELDSILDVLRELQKQGVVIPATQNSSAAGFVFRPLRS